MGLIISTVQKQLAVLVIHPLKVPMNNSKYRQMIADSEPLRGISTFTTPR